MLREHYPKGTRRARAAKVHLVRFADDPGKSPQGDDWLITGSSKALLEGEIKPRVAQFLRERGLELAPEKTLITHIDDGFDFLGQHVRKYRGKLLIKPAPKSVKRLLDRVRATIKAHRHRSAGLLIVKLNPLICGWAQYHRHVVSKRTFGRVDHAIYQALWRWAKRRHPNKGKRWVKQKYFKTIGSRRWVFYGEWDGKERRLFAAANRMVEDTAGHRQLLHLWEAQQGRCPVCDQPITRETGWHQHHILWRAKGGPDTADNRVLLHPDCHRKVHRQHLYVEKPRPTRGVSEA